MHIFAKFLTITLIAIGWINPLFSQEWTRFRGPNGSGISSIEGIPTRWTGQDYKWTFEFSGRGHSSPVIWQNKLYVTSSDEASTIRSLYCIDTDKGTKNWQVDFEFSNHKKHKTNSYATSSPACDAEGIYLAWQSHAESFLAALDHDGNEKWRIDLGPFRGGHGSGASPIVVKDTIVFCHDHEGDSYRIAVNKHTGKQIWKVERPGKRACYATPCVLKRDGKTEIICCHSYDGMASIDLESGKVNWRITPFGEFKQRAIGSVIAHNDLIYAGSGFTSGERNVIAVRPHANESPTEIFRVQRGAPHIPTPIVYNGLLFLWDDKGIVTTVSAKDGQMIWQKRIGGKFFGSPVCVAGNLYCVDRNGTVVVIAAADKFNELGRSDLGDPTFATPAVAGDSIYFRTEKKLFAIKSDL